MTVSTSSEVVKKESSNVGRIVHIPLKLRQELFSGEFALRLGKERIIYCLRCEKHRTIARVRGQVGNVVSTCPVCVSKDYPTVVAVVYGDVLTAKGGKKLGDEHLFHERISNSNEYS